jgi:hypothetical protein
MKKATGKTPPVIKKPLSFIVDHNKVTPTKREVTPKTPTNPHPKGEEGVRLFVAAGFILLGDGLRDAIGKEYGLR